MEELENPKPENPDKAEAEAAAAADASRKLQVKALGAAVTRTLGRLLPRLGLYLFMLAAPLVIVAYPGYLLVDRLAAYAAAQTVETEFVGMDINKIRDLDNKSSLFKSKGHIDVKLSFKAKDGKTYVAVVEKPWTSPGLKGKMEDQYLQGDPYTLYRMTDGTVHVEEDVARDNFLQLTLLMGLVLIAYGLFVLIRKRLSTQQPAIVHLAASATANSLLVAQAVALLVAALMTMALGYQPVFIPDLVYLCGYWGIVAFVAISLRLLVFQAVHPEAVAEAPAETEKPRAQRP